jgi:hypothetical protein
MNKTKYILLIGLLLLSVISMAEVIVLRSGQRVVGEIVLQNDEVVIVRGENGMRYQYPMNEVSSIGMEEEIVVEENEEVEVKKKAVSLRLQAMGGALYAPLVGLGGQVGADLMVGANLLENRLFVGGAVGYRAKVVEKETYSFIPLQVCVSSVLSEARAAVLGMNVGYGFAANGNTQGGICVGAEVGWRFEINADTRLLLGVNTEWQQAKTDVVETIVNPTTNEQNEYINHMGVNFISFGAKLAIHF